MDEVDRNLEKIRTRKGVKCVVVINSNGMPFHVLPSDDGGMEEEQALQFANLAYQVTMSTKTSIHQFNAQEELHVLRIRLRENEVMIVPEEKYFLIVIQDPTKS